MNKLMIVEKTLDRWRWMFICSKLAKAQLRAIRDYHRWVLRCSWNLSKQRISNYTYTCKACDETTTITAKDVHCKMSGQNQEQANILWDELSVEKREYQRKLRNSK